MTASGTVAVNGANGITTTQTTFPLVNATATTINMGGAATNTFIGANSAGTGSNVFVGNTVGTLYSNLTIRARGVYNQPLNGSVASGGGYPGTFYTNVATTGGSGTGMIVTIQGGASGYLAGANVTNPGTGYRNGDTITIPAGSVPDAQAGGSGASFTLTNYNPNYSGNTTGQADYLFGIDGNLTLPGNVTIASVGSIRYANGVNYASTITGTYSNTNVASYLTTATITTTGNVTAGNLITTGAYGNITGANVISANTVSATNFVYSANGVSILTGMYSNTNVASYLTSGITTANLTATGNIVQQSAYYETYGNVSNTGGNLTCNFNLGTVFYAALTANVTANFTNVNAIASTVTGATIIVDQGATAYRVANVQVNGVNQTIRWVGAAVGAGTASNTDIMSFSLIHLGGAAYRVLGQISNYG
jgi:hypothetical protein